MKRDCTLVLTLNEIDGLRLLWDEIPIDAFNTVLAVDGGSTDGTNLDRKRVPFSIKPFQGVAWRFVWLQRRVVMKLSVGWE